ncbi:hypothetical protein SUDANB38_00698 [Streptomyces sp. enrichment culture]
MGAEPARLLLREEIGKVPPGGARPLDSRRSGNQGPVALVSPDVFWMVALLAVDGRQYVYRVYAPGDARPGDLFWAAFHRHDEDRLPRASDLFDSAEIWRPRL